MNKKTLSIIIPAFNEEECLPTLFPELESVIRGSLSNLDVEVVIVDDHSSDKTREMLTEAAKKYSWLKNIRLLKNSGSHIAIFAGLSVCRGDMAFIMGADLQDPPAIIPAFIDKLKADAKIVLGEREFRKDPLLKTITANIFNFVMSRFVLKNFPVKGGDVFLIDRDIISAVLQCEEKNVNIFVLMLSLCDDVSFVQYKRQERFAGQSKWTPGKLVKLAYDSIITVSFLPMKLVFWSGAISFFISILFVLYAIFASIFGITSVPGWTTLFIAVSGFSGVQLISLSVLGEYLWRNVEQTRKRPIFILEKEATSDDLRR
jgi:glycosyltransferase involved in cell wall biosynthesis